MAINSSVSFSGIAGIRAVRFPFGRGVVPSTACIYCVPQNITTGTGDLTLNYGGTNLVFPGMAVADAHVSIRQDRRHPIMRVYVKDRRWQWAGKSISGDWNRRLADGTVDTSTAKTPAELASLLLNALGEGSYDVSRMPTGVRPRCLWQNERADLALQRLCDYVACEVVLNPLTNAVEIWPAGVGGSAPEAVGEILPKIKFVPRAYVPSLVRVNCGYSVWQSRLLLKAVARNHSDGKQKLLAAWEGMPSGGLSTESPISFPNIASTNNRVRAFEDYLRTFRVVGQENGSLGVGNFPYPISSMEQYILQDQLLDTEQDLDGYRRNLPCYVEGDYWAYTDVASNASSQRFTGPFRLHRERRLVEFEFPVFKLSSSGAYEEPKLYLVTSYQLRTANGEMAGLYRTGSVGGSGGQLILNRPELFSTYSTSTAPGSTASTEAQTIAEADAYVQLFVAKYQNPLAAVITYPGLQFGSLDGYKAQATWEWSVTQGPVTRVYEGDAPGDPLAPSLAAQKQGLKLEALA